MSDSVLCRTWFPGGEDDGQVRSLLEAARDSDGFLEYECALILGHLRIAEGILRSLHLTLYYCLADGWPAGYLLTKEFDGSVTWALELFVVPEHRRTGMALRLMRHAAGTEEALGRAWWMGEITKENEPARELLRKLGHAEIGRHEYPRGEIEVWGARVRGRETGSP